MVFESIEMAVKVVYRVMRVLGGRMGGLEMISRIHLVLLQLLVRSFVLGGAVC